MWVSANKAVQSLGLDKETLFKYRDDGTSAGSSTLAAFKETRSRDTYRWNVNAVKKDLVKKGLMAA